VLAAEITTVCRARMCRPRVVSSYRGCQFDLSVDSNTGHFDYRAASLRPVASPASGHVGT